MKSDSIKDQIRDSVRLYYDQLQVEASAEGSPTIPLMVPSFGWEEVWNALDSLLSGNVTMGAKVAEFENAFADYVGTQHAVMVNSGSSANLLALAALANQDSKRPLTAGGEIITPALTWATTVSPIVQTGFIPVFVDVELDTFNIDPDAVASAISDRTTAIMIVHLLGNPCDMEPLMRIADEHNLPIIEDSCESHGATYQGKRTGSFGDIGTFSFYFSHHITTVEGGMLVTDREDLAELCRRARGFGWTRYSQDEAAITERYPDIDPRYLFADLGYNFRPMEIQGAFGLAQIGKLDGFLADRRDTANYFNDALSQHPDIFEVITERPSTQHSWFAFPIMLNQNAGASRNDLMQFLESKGVETRPVMAGNILDQPVAKRFEYRVSGDLTNASAISERTVLVGNHHGIGDRERAALKAYLGEFANRCRAS